jgi:hypothetical protein
MPMELSHHTYPGELRWPAIFCNRQRRLHCGLPFLGIVFCLGQFPDVLRGVADRDQSSLAR